MNWEYKTLGMNIPGWPIPEAQPKEIDLELNRAGRDGRELVSAFDTNVGAGASYQLVAIFKRPREAK